MSIKSVSFSFQCTSCGGTGLYCGFMEPKGTAVVCLGCNGSGMETCKVTPFTGRKKRRGIKSIRQSQGTLLATGVGGKGGPMSYAEFERRYPAGRTDG